MGWRFARVLRGEGSAAVAARELGAGGCVLAWGGGETSVDHEHLAGDIGGVLGGEECDGAGDFLGLAEAAHGDAFEAGFPDGFGDG